ncbi:hypothetical protein SELMODRAFT_427014 [Selaginella moellendorffii]|uniref:Uncharacterized protein n=1 Tax=Selaginella moellendorffii TaxID=88036 RepID=D8SY86_SELML|nr:hypothetical protein SELMODRAFT_427014 [Selaginella moellendorffii]
MSFFVLLAFVFSSILAKSQAQISELCKECTTLFDNKHNHSVVKFGQFMCENFCDEHGKVVGLNSVAVNAEEMLVCDRCRKSKGQFMCSLCNPEERSKIQEEDEDDDDDDLPYGARRTQFFWTSNETSCDTCRDRLKSPFCFQCSLKEECRSCNNTVECKTCDVFRQHTVHVSKLWLGEDKPSKGVDDLGNDRQSNPSTTGTRS